MCSAHRPVTDENFVVESVIDVRGKPGCNRFYLVKWPGYDGDPMEESTWETEATVRADGIMSAVDDFWDSRPDLDKSSCCEIDGEHRCTRCCNPKPTKRKSTPLELLQDPSREIRYVGKGSIFETERGLKRHQARCGNKKRSRTGTRTLRAAVRAKKEEAAESRTPIQAGPGSEAAAEFVFDFKYLGFWFAGDGYKWRHVQIRMAMAICHGISSCTDSP